MEGGTLLTEQDLADRWRCSTSKVAKLRVKGEGPEYVKFGRHVRYRLADVEDWEAGQLRHSTSDRGAA